MSGADSFFDTSVLLYLLSDDPVKADRIENLANFMQGHLQFTQSDNCKLIQYLNAYDAPRCE